MHFTFSILVVLLSVFSRALSEPRNLDLLIRISEDTFPENQAQVPTTEIFRLDLKDDERRLVPIPKNNAPRIGTSNFVASTDHPKYSDTAKILLFNDFNFQGDEKGYQVHGQKCYDLPANLRGHVLSAKLEDKIWYCSVFATLACQGKSLFTLGAGEYENLIPEGLDLVSFVCELYERRDGGLSSVEGGFEAEVKLEI